MTGGPKKTEMLYQPIKVLEIFQDWKLIEFIVGEVERSEGQMHSGDSHVIQMIFQKQL